MKELTKTVGIILGLIFIQTWSTIVNPSTTLHKTRETARGIGQGHNRSSQLVPRRDNAMVPVYQICSRPNSFALTYDDGPSQYSEQLDQTLSEHQARASFFMNGYNYGCIYDHADLLVKRFKAGHLLGSHTWGHVALKEATYEQIHLQLELLEKAFILILGVKPLWFRPPYGGYNDLVRQVLAERGYKGLVMWTEDSEDSLTPRPSSEQIIEAYSKYSKQSNVLSHETLQLTVLEVSPVVIPRLAERGLALVTVTQCLDISDNPNDWYQYIGPFQPRNESWTCEGTPGPGKLE